MEPVIVFTPERVRFEFERCPKCGCRLVHVKSRAECQRYVDQETQKIGCGKAYVYDEEQKVFRDPNPDPPKPPRWFDRD